MEEYWWCDLDLMIINEFFVEIDEKICILIFIVEYLEDDLKFVKFWLIKEWKEYCLCYKNVFYFN